MRIALIILLLLQGCAIAVTTVDVVVVKDNEVNISPPKEIFINKCIEDPLKANRTLREISNSKGDKVVVKGVRCYSA